MDVHKVAKEVTGVDLDNDEFFQFMLEVTSIVIAKRKDLVFVFGEVPDINGGRHEYYEIELRRLAEMAQVSVMKLRKQKQQ